MILRNSEGWDDDDVYNKVSLSNIEFEFVGNKAIGIKYKFNKSKSNKYGRNEFGSAACSCKYGHVCAVHKVINMIRLRIIERLR